MQQQQQQQQNTWTSGDVGTGHWGAHSLHSMSTACKSALLAYELPQSQSHRKSNREASHRQADLEGLGLCSKAASVVT